MPEMDRTFYYFKVRPPHAAEINVTIEDDTQEAAARTLADVLRELGTVAIEQRAMKRETPGDLSIFLVDGKRRAYGSRHMWAALGLQTELGAREVLAKAETREV